MKIVLSGLDAAAWSLVALQVVLRREGHTVRVAADVLGACRRERPDCVVLSTTHGASGVDVLRDVRADPDLAGVPVVLGGRIGGTRAELLALGYDEVFPVAATDPGGAVAALREYLRRQSRRSTMVALARPPASHIVCRP
ncbi:methylmalonyl-CoA mutase [Amycolatopsis sp. NPDC005961]|uniref:methylmalonyl-CoA mutase n=1 Tax=Amycolatopsis sp. NPDC005961 TaxID=3156720 RepID=UPI003401F462